MAPDLSLDDFLRLATEHSVVPVARRVLADRETAVSLFEKLVGDGPGFLFESLQGGERWARWSFVGWDALATLKSRSGASTFSGTIKLDLPDTDPLSVLEYVTDQYSTPDLPGLPPLHSGLVGYLGYDCVRYVERLPNGPVDDRGLPEMLWQFAGTIAAIDNLNQEVILIRNVVVGDNPREQHAEANRHLDEAVRRLGSSAEYRPTVVESLERDLDLTNVTSTMEQSAFEAGVLRAKEYIVQGEAFQVVLSQRMAQPFDGKAFEVYRSLRHINPSPYLFFFRDEELSIVGSSPELMTRVRDGKIYSRPIAGTLPRGATEEEDLAFEQQLLNDPKERAEHVMLIDLARNDVGRVSEFGSVAVNDLMVIERYSHVMHIVSGVSGVLREGVGPVAALRATFPHGTVSGAPKVRAMEIIDELEPVARGPYAGAVGYVDFSGNVDTAICLRTVVIADGTAWVQAGGGLVHDSDPTSEYEESMNKAAAALHAVQAASRL